MWKLEAKVITKSKIYFKKVFFLFLIFKEGHPSVKLSLREISYVGYMHALLHTNDTQIAPSKDVQCNTEESR